MNCYSAGLLGIRRSLACCSVTKRNSTVGDRTGATLRHKLFVFDDSVDLDLDLVVATLLRSSSGSGCDASLALTLGSGGSLAY